MSINKLRWQKWKEQNLINKEGDWKIIPLFINNKWAINYKKHLPILYKTLQKIVSFGSLRQIAISKLGPNTKLNPHCGWASYSNYHLRCHYPIYLPRITNINDYSYVCVENEIKIHNHNQFLLFDDSKNHFAHNGSSNDERIVLIMDFIRPSNIPMGTSNIEDTAEYLEFINEWNKYPL
jgi:hypothetical protein